jgi:hypothetical protein
MESNWSMVCVSECFETKVMCMWSCRDFEVNIFGSMKVYFPVWIDFIFFGNSCTQRQNLSVVHVNEFLGISTNHVGNFKLFGDKKIQGFFTCAKRWFCLESILASFQYQFLGLVNAHSCNLQMVKCHTINKHGGFLSYCHDSYAKLNHKNRNRLT